MKRIAYSLLLAASLTAFLSPSALLAQTSPAPAPAALLPAVTDNSNFNTFAGYARSESLAATFRAAGTFTVLAPHNVIFRNLPFAKVDSMTSDTARLARLVKAHTIKGKFPQAEINRRLTLGKGKFTVNNLLGDPLVFSVAADKTLVITDKYGVSVSVIEFNLVDPKSVVHGIDKILGKP